MNSIGKNYFYNIILTILNIAYPLIISPYVSRVLGAENLGKLSTIDSLAGFMTYFAYFGIQIYGVREVAKAKKSKKDTSKIISELFCIQIITTIIALIIYSIVVKLLLSSINNFIIYIYFISLSLCMINLDWIFAGWEEFKYITIRLALIKIITFLLIILLIRKSSDYILYSSLLVISTLIMNIISLIIIFRKVKISFININPIRHLKKLFYFGITSITWAIYGLLDIFILGVMSTNVAVAFFSKGKQILTIMLSVTTAASKVMLPRLSEYYDTNKEKYKSMIDKSINFIFLLCFPSAIGIFIFSREIMYFIGGNDFVQGHNILRIMSPWLIICAIATFIDNQISIPSGNEKITTISSICVAIISIILNLVLIPKLSYIGSAIAFLIAEFIGMSIQIVKTKQILNYNFNIFAKIKYIIASVFMASVAIIMKKIITNYIMRLIIIVPICVIIYFVVLILSKEEFITDNLKRYRTRRV